MGKRKRGDANNPIDIVSSTPGKSFFFVCFNLFFLELSLFCLVAEKTREKIWKVFNLIM